MRKLLYIVLDGLGDRPIKELSNKTPLAAARTPNMDALAPSGKMALVHTVGKGIAPESDIAVISILGYDAHKCYTGRGPLESFAEGLEVKDGDLAYRVNFATLGDGRKIIDRRVGRNLTTEEATVLSKEINEKVKLTDAAFRFKNSVGHRGVLTIRSNKTPLSSEVTNTDPAYGKEGVFGVALTEFENLVKQCEPTPEGAGLKGAIEAARLTNEFVEKSSIALNDSEINKKRIKEGKLSGNVILTRDGGDRLPEFPSIKEKFNLKMGCFVEMPVERGIALLTGMDIVELPLPSGDLEKDYTLRADKVIDAMEVYDSLYIHIKGPDEPAHDGNYRKKVESIEKIDRHFLGNLIPRITIKDTIIAITADHSTPCGIKAHSADPVPFVMLGGKIKGDGLLSFSESTCKSGSIGELMGNQIMDLLVKQL
ncbi:alkaline phosphatase family protein [Candidatus Omnitrophota bacterium]